MLAWGWGQKIEFKKHAYKRGRRHGWEETNTGLWVSQRQRDSQGRSLAMQKKPDFFRQRK